MPLIPESTLRAKHPIPAVNVETKESREIYPGETVTVLDFLQEYDKYLVETLTNSGRDVLEVQARDLELSVIGERTWCDSDISLYLESIGITQRM